MGVRHTTGSKVPFGLVLSSIWRIPQTRGGAVCCSQCFSTFGSNSCAKHGCGSTRKWISPRSFTPEVTRRKSVVLALPTSSRICRANPTGTKVQRSEAHLCVFCIIFIRAQMAFKPGGPFSTRRSTAQSWLCLSTAVKTVDIGKENCFANEAPASSKYSATLALCYK